MEQPITIGLDLAKSVFQVHGVDSDGTVVLRRQLRRSQVLALIERLSPCLVGMACSGAPHWAREIGARGHEVRLMPPTCVKPYVTPGSIAHGSSRREATHDRRVVAIAADAELPSRVIPHHGVRPRLEPCVPVILPSLPAH